jgi:hypothetical protein
MKKVIIVKGSEDGVIGVYTNKKLAFEAATEYANNPTLTYPQFCKEMRVQTYANQGDGYGYAICNTFILNN